MICFTISKNPNGSVTVKDNNRHKMTYYFLSVKNAVKCFRREFGYIGIKVNIIYI